MKSKQRPEQKVTEDEAIPPGLEYFKDKSVAEVLGQVFPQKETLAKVAGFLSGLGLDIGVKVPEWAKQASRQFWKYYVGDKFDPIESIEDAGVLVRILERFGQSTYQEHEPQVVKHLMRSTKPLLEIIEKAVRDFPPADAAKFYAGRARADGIIEKMQNADHLKMIKLAGLYTAVALSWENLLTFSTHAGRERWLRCEKFIGENLTSREVYQAFARIGLPGAVPGRPKKSNT